MIMEISGIGIQCIKNNFRSASPFLSLCNMAVFNMDNCIFQSFCYIMNNDLTVFSKMGRKAPGKLEQEIFQIIHKNPPCSLLVSV